MRSEKEDGATGFKEALGAQLLEAGKVELGELDRPHCHKAVGKQTAWGGPGKTTPVVGEAEGRGASVGWGCNGLGEQWAQKCSQ